MQDDDVWSICCNSVMTEHCLRNGGRNMRQECCARVRIKILQLLYDRLSSTETVGGTLGDELQLQTALTPTHGPSIVGREGRPDLGPGQWIGSLSSVYTTQSLARLEFQMNVGSLGLLIQ